MEAERLLEALCRRHGLHAEAGEEMLPLVRWALGAPPEVRERVLATVERSLGLADRAARERAADEALLQAVARVLHDWSPSQGILDLGGSAA